MTIDYFQLASAIVIWYSALFPLHIAKIVYISNKRFFNLSMLFALGLLTHGFYHLFSSMSISLLRYSFELVSALLLLLFVIYYMVVERHG